MLAPGTGHHREAAISRAAAAGWQARPGPARRIAGMAARVRARTAACTQAGRAAGIDDRRAPGAGNAGRRPRPGARPGGPPAGNRSAAGTRASALHGCSLFVLYGAHGERPSRLAPRHATPGHFLSLGVLRKRSEIDGEAVPGRGRDAPQAADRRPCAASFEAFGPRFSRRSPPRCTQCR